MLQSIGHSARPPAGIGLLGEWLCRHRNVVALTGAGCSTGSGIPDYRDANGEWKRQPPVQLRDFLNNHRTRQRYWARGLLGWRHFSRAVPNEAHAALAELERLGRVATVITQNVDRLHQRAGSRAVIDLHGRLDRVVCLGCGVRQRREALQTRLETENPVWASLTRDAAPDGDADLAQADFSSFRVPACTACGGVLKPDVVFFGEAIPAQDTLAAREAVRKAGALLVVGSSLMVWSGFRLVREAAERDVPVAAINLGRTRADHLLTLKLEADCSSALSHIAAGLGP